MFGTKSQKKRFFFTPSHIQTALHCINSTCLYILLGKVIGSCWSGSEQNVGWVDWLHECFFVLQNEFYLFVWMFVGFFVLQEEFCLFVWMFVGFFCVLQKRVQAAQMWLGNGPWGLALIVSLQLQLNFSGGIMYMLHMIVWPPLLFFLYGLFFRPVSVDKSRIKANDNVFDPRWRERS